MLPIEHNLNTTPYIDVSYLYVWFPNQSLESNNGTDSSNIVGWVSVSAEYACGIGLCP